MLYDCDMFYFGNKEWQEIQLQIEIQICTKYLYLYFVFLVCICVFLVCLCVFVFIFQAYLCILIGVVKQLLSIYYATSDLFPPPRTFDLTLLNQDLKMHAMPFGFKCWRYPHISNLTNFELGGWNQVLAEANCSKSSPGWSYF